MNPQHRAETLKDKIIKKMNTIVTNNPEEVAKTDAVIPEASPAITEASPTPAVPESSSEESKVAKDEHKEETTNEKL